MAAGTAEEVAKARLLMEDCESLSQLRIENAVHAAARDEATQGGDALSLRGEVWGVIRRESRRWPPRRAEHGTTVAAVRQVQLLFANEAHERRRAAANGRRRLLCGREEVWRVGRPVDGRQCPWPISNLTSWSSFDQQFYPRPPKCLAVRRASLWCRIQHVR